jgi:hypothetical protein
MTLTGKVRAPYFHKAPLVAGYYFTATPLFPYSVAGL